MLRRVFSYSRSRADISIRCKTQNYCKLKTIPCLPDLFDLHFSEFLRPGAPCEINIDGKTMERTQELLKNPTRFTYDYAADHIFDLLLKKDCYPRFLRSEHYKNLLTNATNPTSKKRYDSMRKLCGSERCPISIPTPR